MTLYLIAPVECPQCVRQMEAIRTTTVARHEQVVICQPCQLAFRISKAEITGVELAFGPIAESLERQFQAHLRDRSCEP